MYIEEKEHISKALYGPWSVHFRIFTIMVQTDAHKYIELSLYTQLPPTCFGQSCGHLQVCKVQTLDTKNLCILHSRRWPHGWPKHVEVHCVYKLISIYLCASVCTIIVYISKDLCNCWVKLLKLNTIKPVIGWSYCDVASELRAWWEIFSTAWTVQQPSTVRAG
jgi:hypothetical protein